MPRLEFDLKSGQIPAKACRFEAEVAVGRSTKDSTAFPITLKARSGGAVDNWFWGRIVHDFAGMTARGKIPLDYRHDDDKPVGFVDRFDASTGDLVVRGFLTPDAGDPNDPTHQIIAKARAGVPYQASIYFDEPMELEELASGEPATVNGREVIGPAVVVRQWTLRGVAVCLYGEDPNTESSLKFTGGGTGPTRFIKCRMTAPSKTKARSAAVAAKFKLRAAIGGPLARFADGMKIGRKK